MHLELRATYVYPCNVHSHCGPCRTSRFGVVLPDMYHATLKYQRVQIWADLIVTRLGIHLHDLIHYILITGGKEFKTEQQM